MMVVVTAATALTLWTSERNFAANIEQELEGDFRTELAGLHQAQVIRRAALVERCRALVRRPRIHAALEDNALDLLYPSAEDELRDIMTPPGEAANSPHSPTVRALFYRFLDRAGRVITPSTRAPVGELAAEDEAKLALPRLSDDPQVGYLDRPSGSDGLPTEVIAMPIQSTDSGETIAALVLGFHPFSLAGDRAMQSGVFVGGRLYLPGVQGELSRQISSALETVRPEEGSRRIRLGDAEYLIFYKRINPGAFYPAAFEVSIYPLAQFAARETQLRLRIVALGVALLLAAFFVSHLISSRLSAPVEKLAVDSERSARFSADASHQLKTPVTVLRAGLEELLTRDNLTPDECDAIGALIHQTYRLSSLIEDLLLLSRMDSGRLQLAHESVDLTHLIAAALDDLSAMPDVMGLRVETDVPPVLHVSGERRYTAIILQNLLENARKYNRPNGIIRVETRLAGDSVLLSIANTGKPISAATQAHIFERFHRGSMGENVPGYGLGLNLARELARLHGGDLRLVRSDDEWTIFEARFHLAEAEVPAA